MTFEKKLSQTKKELSQIKIDGWLLYDFRRSNELACQFLEIPADRLLTRRFFYWIPAGGEPIKLVHAIEDKVLSHLPGKTRRFRTWQELEEALRGLLSGVKRVAMEYSPYNRLPAISRVDGGTIELVRSSGVEVVSSADLLHAGIWDEPKWRSHFAAAKVVDTIATETWDWIANGLEKSITEYEVQQFILERFSFYGCHSDDPPICAVNAHSADPHYLPSQRETTTIRRGDFILIDLWCRQKGEESVYADITRVAVALPSPTARQQEIFSIVRSAQKAATELVRHRFAEKKPLMGWEVDQAARDLIQKAGYGDYFIHRTGHNIDLRDHGPGTHMDNYETHDDRHILPATCFSIEPGIYLPGEFGVRLEYDLFVHPDGRVQVTGGEQNQIQTLV
jgi:Xaa-Pro aminopeptidase